MSLSYVECPHCGQIGIALEWVDMPDPGLYLEKTKSGSGYICWASEEGKDGAIMIWHQGDRPSEKL